MIARIKFQDGLNKIINLKDMLVTGMNGLLYIPFTFMTSRPGNEMDNVWVIKVDDPKEKYVKGGPLVYRECSYEEATGICNTYKL